MAELPGMGLGQAGLEGVEHPERESDLSVSSNWWVRVMIRPSRCRTGRLGRAGGPGPAGTVPVGAPSSSVPATRIPLMVR